LGQAHVYCVSSLFQSSKTRLDEGKCDEPSAGVLHPTCNEA
jgi:hypothetical protein